MSLKSLKNQRLIAINRNDSRDKSPIFLTIFAINRDFVGDFCPPLYRYSLRFYTRKLHLHCYIRNVLSFVGINEYFY